MRIAAIVIAMTATASAGPATLKDTFARIAARQSLPQLCFAATADRSLVACLGTTDGKDKALCFFHVIGPTASDGAVWH